MPSFRTSRRVGHSARQMFDLVADIERYPDFLPLCTGLSVRRRSTDPQGRPVILANMSVGYKAIRETFGSRVTLDAEMLAILVEYVDGPFSRMENKWTCVHLPDGKARVDFFIDYEFRSRTLGFLMGAMFDTAFRKFSEAFEKRADAIYGRGSPSRPLPGQTV